MGQPWRQPEVLPIMQACCGGKAASTRHPATSKARLPADTQISSSILLAIEGKGFWLALETEAPLAEEAAPPPLLLCPEADEAADPLPPPLLPWLPSLLRRRPPPTAPLCATLSFWGCVWREKVASS